MAEVFNYRVPNGHGGWMEWPRFATRDYAEKIAKAEVLEGSRRTVDDDLVDPIGTAKLDPTEENSRQLKHLYESQESLRYEGDINQHPLASLVPEYVASSTVGAVTEFKITEKGIRAARQLL